MVVCPGDQAAIARLPARMRAACNLLSKRSRLGYGHAVHCAAEFSGDQPFLLLVGDHLYVSRAAKGLRAATGGGRESGIVRRVGGAGHA